MSRVWFTFDCQWQHACGPESGLEQSFRCDCFRALARRRLLHVVGTLCGQTVARALCSEVYAAHIPPSPGRHSSPGDGPSLSCATTTEGTGPAKGGGHANPAHLAGRHQPLLREASEVPEQGLAGGGHDPVRGTVQHRPPTAGAAQETRVGKACAGTTTHNHIRLCLCLYPYMCLFLCL